MNNRQQTGGTYECNYNHIRVQTTATHMNIGVARMIYSTDVEGLSRETGIMPDSPVEPAIDDLLAGQDAVKQFAMKLIRERSRTQ